jgi:tetratricopeptide (TPR) repeat protein
MRAFRACAGLVLMVLAAACATRTPSLPAPSAPHFPDFVQPSIPPDLAGPFAERTDRAWLFLQAGDLRTADRETSSVLKARPEFYPAQTTAAYVALARKDAKAAVTQFSRVADAHPSYAPALVGKGLALQASGQNAEALQAFRAALKVDPSLGDVARRVDVLTLRGLQDELAAARQAARNGQPDAAIRAYQNAIAASPDSAFLYRELAGVERQQGQTSTAIEHLRRANELDPTDAGSFALLGDLLAQQGDDAAALQAYSESLRLESDPTVEEKRSAVRARVELASMPEQYRQIENSAQLTRAELAALIAVRLAPLLQSAPQRDIGVLTDVRGHWAERWISQVARAGIMEPFPNHTFQPRALVRRVDLAQAVTRLLNLIAVADPGRARTWTGARGRFSDMTAGHLAYPAASTVVAAGVMQTADGGAFQPTRVVSGAEAIAVLDRVRTLAGPVATAAADRR